MTGQRLWLVLGAVGAGLLLGAGLFFAVRDDGGSAVPRPTGGLTASRPVPPPVASTRTPPVPTLPASPTVARATESASPEPAGTEEPQVEALQHPEPLSLLGARPSVEELIRWLDISAERVAHEQANRRWLAFLNDPTKSDDELLFQQEQQAWFAIDGRWTHVRWTRHDARLRLARLGDAAVPALRRTVASGTSERRTAAQEILREIDWLKDLAARQREAPERLSGDVLFFPGSRTVVAPGQICLTVGALEYFACLTDGKTHESVVAITCLGADLDRGLRRAGFKPGPDAGGLTKQGDTAMPVGDPLVVYLEWLDQDGRPVRRRAEELITDLTSPAEPKAAMQRTPFIYTGSKMITGNDGREHYLPDVERVAIAVYSDVSAILNNPLPGRLDDNVYACRTTEIPPENTPVKVLFAPAPPSEVPPTPPPPTAPPATAP